MNYDVFISHSSRDQKAVEVICTRLEAQGITCFVSYRDAEKGGAWARTIAEALENSRMMLAIASENFNLSRQTDREVGIAGEKDPPMPMLVFRLSDAKFEGVKHYYLNNLNWINAFPDPTKHFGELYEIIQNMLAKEALSKNRNSAATAQTQTRTQIPRTKAVAKNDKNVLKIAVAAGAVLLTAVVAVVCFVLAGTPVPESEFAEVYDQSVRAPEQGEKESNGKHSKYSRCEWADLMFNFADQYAKSLSVELLGVDTNGRDTFNLSYRVGVRRDRYQKFIEALQIKLEDVRNIQQGNYPVLEIFDPEKREYVKWHIPTDIFKQMVKSSGESLACYEVCILLKGEFDDDTGEREILKKIYIPLPEDLAPEVSDGKLRLGPNAKKAQENFAGHREDNLYWLDEKNDINTTVSADVFEKVEDVSIQVVPAAKCLGEEGK